MPLPGSHVIHPDWISHHRPVAEGGFTAAVHINAEGTGEPVWDDADQVSRTPAGPERYLGGARIQLLTLTEAQRLVAEQQITTLAYLVVVSLDATTVEVDDIVTIDQVDADGDQSLIGRQLRVRAVARGSLAWERDLVCTDDLG